MRGAPVHLTPTEYRLAGRAHRGAGQVVTHSELLKAGWGQGKLDQQHLRSYLCDWPAPETGNRSSATAVPAKGDWSGYRLRAKP